MKISPKEKELDVNLGPSKFSANGFLGDDTFVIDELITSDKRKMEDLGVTSIKLATKLKEVYDQAQKACGSEVEINSNLFVTFFESRGKIPSPFPGHGVFEKGEVRLVEKVTGRQIIITKLGIALIESYCFFQGPNSRYRIDPESTIKLLEII